MSQQTDLLREIAAAMSSGAPDRISDWFTEDFRLHEPGAPPLPTGHEGARQMRARFRTLDPPIKLEILDMIEEGDRVAVRWQLTQPTKADPLNNRSWQSIALRTDASPRIGASLLRRIGPEDATWSQMFGSDQ